MDSADLAALIRRLSGLYPHKIDLTLDRIRALMARLGNPQDHLPPVIHLAGTNGKGSTLAMLRACYEAAGYRVHAFTSPPLRRFAEQIRLAGSIIGDGDLAELLAEIEAVNAGAPITLFEATTAAAFLAFRRVPADIVLLETGMGGRLDSTNLVREPAVTAITPISLDHMAFLGDTLPLIAAEKAGILRPGRPALFGPQAPEVLDVLRASAQRIGAIPAWAGADWQAIPGDTGWTYQHGEIAQTLPDPSLPGRHQIDNAGLALACLDALPGLPVAADARSRGLQAIDWPARLQRLTRPDLVAGLPEGSQVWLDGAHNPGGMAVLAAHFAGNPGPPVSVILALLANRPVAAMLAPLAPVAASIYAIPVPAGILGSPTATVPSQDPKRIQAEAASLGINADVAESVAAALANLRAEADGPRRIVICGTLVLAGSVLAG